LTALNNWLFGAAIAFAPMPEDDRSSLENSLRSLGGRPPLFTSLASIERERPRLRRAAAQAAVALASEHEREKEFTAAVKSARRGVELADLANHRGAIGDAGRAREGPGGLVGPVDRGAELVV